jgi:hypothetical protein
VLCVVFVGEVEAVGEVLREGDVRGDLVCTGGKGPRGMSSLILVSLKKGGGTVSPIVKGFGDVIAASWPELIKYGLPLLGISRRSSWAIKSTVCMTSKPFLSHDMACHTSCSGCASTRSMRIHSKPSSLRRFAPCASIRGTGMVVFLRTNVTVAISLWVFTLGATGRLTRKMK